MIDDHTLTMMVDAAAEGVINSAAQWKGGPTWEELDSATKNQIREAALPFIFHGTKILPSLGFSKAPIDLQALGE